MHSFTLEDLVQYLYNETSPQKSAAIKAALDTDWSLREQYEVLTSAHSNLNTVSHAPREEAVNNILKYAEKAVSAITSEV